MSGSSAGGAAPDSAAHLIERAAERLRREGVAASMIDARPNGAVAAGTQPGYGPAPFAPAAGLSADAQEDDGRPVVSTAQLVGAGMIDWSKTRTRISEEFRVVQAQILRQAFAADASGLARDYGASLMGDVPREPGAVAPSISTNLVMVTSSRPGEGKSFAALNLAASVARQRDREVLLIDIDRKPDALGGRLGLTNVPGLTDLASDPRQDPQRAIIRTEMSHLSLLPFGAHENAAEVVASRHMARVIRGIGRRYAERLVILDAPPCLSSSEASVMAAIVGQVLFVVEAEQTQRAEVEAALDMLTACPTITLLLNKVQARTRHSFGGYYYLYSQS